MAFRSVFVVKVVRNWHWPHQGACLFTFGCFCCCVGLPFLLLGLPFCFVIIFLQVGSPFCGLPGLGFGAGLVTVSRLTLCSYVPCFVAFIFRWARGARVSSGLSPFLGWIVCVVCPVAVAIVWYESCLLFSCFRSFALLLIVRDHHLVCDLLGGICFSPLPFLLSYFLVNISLMFMFRWKANVGGLGKRCCMWLFLCGPILLWGLSSSFWGEGGIW